MQPHSLACLSAPTSWSASILRSTMARSISPTRPRNTDSVSRKACFDVIRPPDLLCAERSQTSHASRVPVSCSSHLHRSTARPTSSSIPTSCLQACHCATGPIAYPFPDPRAAHAARRALGPIETRGTTSLTAATFTAHITCPAGTATCTASAVTRASDHKHLTMQHICCRY